MRDEAAPIYRQLLDERLADPVPEQPHPTPAKEAAMAVDITDYSHTALDRGWGPGWPSCQGVKDAGTTIVQATRSGTRLSVHRRIARLVGLLVDETERRGYLLRPGQCWGYDCRPISGTDVASNHSWGLAVDINAPANPYRTPRVTDIPTWVPQLWNLYGFAWGGNYNHDGATGPADSMHFEFMGAPADADALTARAAADLAGSPSPTPSPEPADVQEDSPVAPIPITVSGGTFRAAIMAETGSVSTVVARSWISVGSTWGDTHFKITALGNEPRLLFDGVVTNNAGRKVELPDGTVMATVEGFVASGAVIPVAALICLPK